MDKDTELYLLSRGIHRDELFMYEMDADSIRLMGVPGGIAPEFLSPQRPVDNTMGLDADGVPESDAADDDLMTFARQLQADESRRQRALEQTARDAALNESQILGAARNMAVKAGKLQPEEDLDALQLDERVRFIQRAADFIGYHNDGEE